MADYTLNDIKWNILQWSRLLQIQITTFSATKALISINTQLKTEKKTKNAPSIGGWQTFIIIHIPKY